jgi:hypothetical protein
MRTALRAAIASATILLASASADAATVKLATWNLNNLHRVLGEPLRSGAPARAEADYELPRKYRDRLGADVIALQEVNGPKAVGLVFPPDQYALFFSARYIDDLVTGKATNPDPGRSARIGSTRALPCGGACSTPSASATSDLLSGAVPGDRPGASGRVGRRIPTRAAQRRGLLPERFRGRHHASAHPIIHRRAVRTTNPLERLFLEERRPFKSSPTRSVRRRC